MPQTRNLQVWKRSPRINRGRSHGYAHGRALQEARDTYHTKLIAESSQQSIDLVAIEKPHLASREALVLHREATRVRRVRCFDPMSLESLKQGVVRRKTRGMAK